MESVRLQVDGLCLVLDAPYVVYKKIMFTITCVVCIRRMFKYVQVMELAERGSVINGATPSSFLAYGSKIL